ncbi:MAG: polyprenyl synthetase family protein [Ignavibacteriaceae bacterium]|nr:polyprenyl synthetase family protein [Ignavibacteriaceae bacterium]
MKHSSYSKYNKFYEKQKAVIDRKLANALKKRKPESLYGPSSYILESCGKRLRPLLVILSAMAAGAKPQKVYNAALSVEMLHNFTLVHDDIMDNADLRRGNLTLHKKYNLNTAILAGDSLLAVAYEYLLKDCDINAQQVISSFTNGLVKVCEGQSLDTEFERQANVTLAEYIDMITKKTAALLQTCCEIGAYLGNGKNNDINALSDYGKHLGIAFQIQDDLLDITADKAEFGKRIGGDLLEGKKTFLFLVALDKAAGKDKEDLMKVIWNKGIRSNQIEKYKRLYEKLGVPDEAKKAIKKCTENALRSIDNLSDKSRIEIFYWLADLLIKRNK